MALLDDIRKSEYLSLLGDKLQGLLDIPTSASKFLVNPTAFIDTATGKTAMPREKGFAEGLAQLPKTENLSVLDPANRAYMEGYDIGEPFGYAGMALPFASAGATKLSDKLVQAITGNPMATGAKVIDYAGAYNPANITTWHGSKSLFDKFDKSKIGSSSGIDYGYGLYSAESPAIAKGFMGKQGFLYKTDIPDEFIPKMINWYETKQTPEVTEILKKAGLPFNATGEEITMAAAQKMGGSDATKSGFQKAAEYLDSLGIRGNKVENFQIKNGQGADTFNYVVYNPENVKILERNNQPITGLLDTSYRGSHTAPNAKEYGATIDNLGALMPKDVYSSEGIRLYGLRDRAIDNEWYMAVKKAEGNPDAEIEVFRAVPKGVTDINSGDWITTSKNYAKMHGENALDGEYDIISKKVKAKTLSSEGYPYEFGYNPD